MPAYRADRIVGGMSSGRLTTFINDEGLDESSRRAGNLTPDQLNSFAASVRRPYLLTLQEGRTNRMMLVEIRSGPKATHRRACF